MSEPTAITVSSSSPDPGNRGWGRGKSRGGLGKYLRARGRRGLGRPAEFGKRLVLEDEETNGDGEEDEDAKSEEARKYSRRQLGSNADRYVELEPELNSDGEVEPEPEVNLSTFLERQRLDDLPARSTPLTESVDDADDVDLTLAHISSRPQATSQPKKGQVRQIDWDDQLDDLNREKAAAEAARELKTRFRAKTERMRGRTQDLSAHGRARKQDKAYVEAPPLPNESALPPKDTKEQMQDFLDDLLG